MEEKVKKFSLSQKKPGRDGGKTPGFLLGGKKDGGMI